jgi:hypothetical protein
MLAKATRDLAAKVRKDSGKEKDPAVGKRLLWAVGRGGELLAELVVAAKEVGGDRTNQYAQNNLVRAGSALAGMVTQTALV